MSASWTRTATAANGLAADPLPSASGSVAVGGSPLRRTTLTYVSGPAGAPSLSFQVYGPGNTSGPIQSVTLAPGGSTTISFPAAPTPSPAPPPAPPLGPFPDPPLLPAQRPSATFPAGLAAQLFSNPFGALGVASVASGDLGAIGCAPFQPAWTPRPDPGPVVTAPPRAPLSTVWIVLQAAPGAPAGVYSFSVA